MPPIIRIALAACVVMATSAAAQSAPSQSPATQAPGPRAVPIHHAADNLPFLAKAAQADMTEVNAGALAEQKGEKASIRAYGQKMMAEHAAHRARVLTLADAKGVVVPTPVNAQQQAAFEDLANLPGFAFDIAYKAHVVAAHRKAIADYEAQLDNPDAQIAALARETLPALKLHLAEAQKI